ncbi:hypothetical protein B0O80DRAFT_299926 [Mortierella sp. GBAus27b]|nr:hypothetical protein B0O80DRAFT_299926 [Mortierella sp. GBAus27b]
MATSLMQIESRWSGLDVQADLAVGVSFATRQDIGQGSAQRLVRRVWTSSLESASSAENQAIWRAIAEDQMLQDAQEEQQQQEEGHPRTIIVVDPHHHLVMGAAGHLCLMAGILMTMDIADVAIPDLPIVVDIIVADHPITPGVTVVALPRPTTATVDVDDLPVPTGKKHHWIHVVFSCYCVSCEKSATNGAVRYTLCRCWLDGCV